MAKYCVPILAVRHGYVIVEAVSEHDALIQGWDAIKANTYIWLIEPTFSVEKPYVYLTQEDFECDDLPQEHGTVDVSAKQLQTYVSKILHPTK